MSLSWAAKRQLIILVILAIIILLVFSVVIYSFIKKTLSTDDVSSPAVAQDISILWERVFASREGSVDAAALLENPNRNFGAKKFVYTFRIYDKNNILIVIKENETFINPGEKFIVFEPNISVQNREPRKTIFEIRSLNWESMEPMPILQIDTLSKNILFDNEMPRAELTIKNQANKSYDNIEAVLVLFSASGDAVATSRTVIDQILIGEEKRLVFTWPWKVSNIESSQIFFRKLP